MKKARPKVVSIQNVVAGVEELDRQIKATGYVVPAGMDQPPESTDKAAKKKGKAKQQ